MSAPLAWHRLAQPAAVAAPLAWQPRLAQPAVAWPSVGTLAAGAADGMHAYLVDGFVASPEVAENLSVDAPGSTAAATEVAEMGRAAVAAYLEETWQYWASDLGGMALEA